MSTIRVNKLYGMLAGDTTLKPAKAVYKGSQEIKKMYKGSTLVWEVGEDTEDLKLLFDVTYNSETEIAVDIEFTGTTGEISVFAQIEDISGNVISERKDYTILVGIDRIVDTFEVTEMIEPCYVVVYDADSYSELGRGAVK